MANADFAFGLKPVMHRDGTPFSNTALRPYSTAAGDGTLLGIGDPVKLAGTSQTVNGRILSDVTRAATGDVIVGVVVGVAPNPADLTSRYRAASTLREVYIADVPDLIFEIQEVSGGTALTADDAGLNANFVVAAASTVTGFSNVELNNATEATTNTLDLHIMGPVNRVDNEIGENCKWLVTINRHQFRNQVAGIQYLANVAMT